MTCENYDACHLGIEKRDDDHVFECDKILHVNYCVHEQELLFKKTWRSTQKGWRSLLCTDYRNILDSAHD